MQQETGIELALREGFELHVAGGLAQRHRHTRVGVAKLQKQPGSGPKPTVETKPSRTRPTSPIDAALATPGRAAAMAQQLPHRLNQRRARRRERHAAAVALEQRVAEATLELLLARLSGGCVMFRRTAARPKCSVSASVRNWRHKRNSTAGSAPAVRVQSFTKHINAGIKIYWTRAGMHRILAAPSHPSTSAP